MTLTLLLLAGFLPLLVFWTLWLVFAALAALPRRGRRVVPNASNSVQIDVLIPAHNEELLLPALLQSLQQQTPAGRSRMGKVIVVADHCTDSTAAIARAHGATVLERSREPRGKPAALRDGLTLLTTESDNALMILDADCVCSANLLEAMAAGLDSGKPVLQASYLLTPADGPAGQSPSLLAFALKNVIRPRGMCRLGIPTQLFGAGMCFHPEVVRSGVLAFDDHLIEDLALSHTLLLQGMPPAFMPDAEVRSPLPRDTSAMSVQKLRWEAGQVQTWKRLPLLAMKLLATGRLRSVIALLDWSAPPLAMAFFVWLMLTIVTASLSMCGVVPAAMLAAPIACISILSLYVFIGTLQVAGPGAVVRLVLAIPRFLVWKTVLYCRMLTGHGPKNWQRTPRTSPTTEVHS